MKIAIIGGGFTGLAAGLKLSQKGYKVSIFEKEKTLGGLASTFKLPSWDWDVEKHYHHWFTNDSFALNLIKELGLGKYLIFPKTVTCLFYKGKIYPFNSAFDVLTFTPLSLIDRARTGIVTAYLKLLPPNIALVLEKYTTWYWLAKGYGKKVFQLIWKPLLSGKFGLYAKSVNMAWFWARIKKRTKRLGYLEGGYHRLLEAMAERIRKNRGKILLESPFQFDQVKKFDRIIATVPSSIFLRLFPDLPSNYRRQLSKIPHLHALNLLLITKEKLLKDTYWLNINEPNFPFIAVIQHTNLVDASHYGGNHLTWIANYLHPNHPYLKMSKEELLKVYLPYLKKINPSFNFSLLTSHLSAQAGFSLQLFLGPFAQPVFPINYSRIKPDFKTPIPNVYLANMDMVYPWDRGTNYAIELGFKVAEVIQKDN